MLTDFGVFRERLAEACSLRGLTHERLCASIGIGGKSAIRLMISGDKALSVDWLTQIADRLEVSIDWLLGRTNVMDVLGLPKVAKSKKR